MFSGPTDVPLRMMPPTRGESSPVVDPGLDREGAVPQPSQQRQPRESTAAPPRHHPETGVVAELASGGSCGDASRLAQPHGGRDTNSVAGGKAGTNEGMMGDAAQVPSPASGGSQCIQSILRVRLSFERSRFACSFVRSTFPWNYGMKRRLQNMYL